MSPFITPTSCSSTTCWRGNLLFITAPWFKTLFNKLINTSLTLSIRTRRVDVCSFSFSSLLVSFPFSVSYKDLYLFVTIFECLTELSSKPEISHLFFCDHQEDECDPVPRILSALNTHLCSDDFSVCTAILCQSSSIVLDSRLTG